MVRAPCCEKMGLKRGPWTREEDQVLVDYVQRHGHSNWRALPKQAGLLRCGKSCRLRWTNYLRPDIKRGNFSPEEEDAIINLHAALGNRWSAIAARLPGRTDNEIKNVWHTHLKKRLSKPSQAENSTTPATKQDPKFKEEEEEEKPIPVAQVFTTTTASQTSFEGQGYQSSSPQQSSSEEISSITTANTGDDSNSTNTYMNEDTLENFPEVDEDFWTEVFSGAEESDLPDVVDNVDYQSQLHNQLPPLSTTGSGCGYSSNLHDGMDFWYDVFTRAGELPESPEF